LGTSLNDLRALQAPLQERDGRSESSAARRRARRRLWLALHLPLLPLEALAVGQTAPARGRRAVLVASGCDARATVVVASPAACDAGIRHGMRVSAAVVLDPGIEVRARDPMAELQALRWLAVRAGCYTALVSLRPPAALLLEIGGSLRLFGGLRALVDAIGAAIAAFGYTARIGIAPTGEAAHLLARAGDARPVRTLEALPGRLAAVPVEHLKLARRTGEALRAIGVLTVGECLRLPRADLARRFGPDLLGQLDVALGRRVEVPERFEAPQRFEREVPFSGEMREGEVREIEPLLEALRRPLVELSGYLHARGEGARRLALLVAHRCGPATRLELELARPSRDPGHLLALLRERLERLTLDRGAVAFGLRCIESVRIAATARDLFGERDREEGAWEVLLEWLRVRVGRHAVGGVEVCADHRPERAWGWCEAGRTDARGAPSGRSARPLWLLEEPAPLALVDGRPWRGGWLEVIEGPERIESGWWDGLDVARDYFVARGAAGERLWIYRDLRAAGEWYLHGLFG
jgi:protein ImuB